MQARLVQTLFWLARTPARQWWDQSRNTEGLFPPTSEGCVEGRLPFASNGPRRRAGLTDHRPNTLTLDDPNRSTMRFGTRPRIDSLIITDYHRKISLM